MFVYLCQDLLEVINWEKFNLYKSKLLKINFIHINLGSDCIKMVKLTHIVYIKYW